MLKDLFISFPKDAHLQEIIECEVSALFGIVTHDVIQETVGTSVLVYRLDDTDPNYTPYLAWLERKQDQLSYHVEDVKDEEDKEEKKVFPIREIYTVEQHFYVAATNKDDALIEAQFVLYPHYICERTSDSSLEVDDDEVKLLTLQRKKPMNIPGDLDIITIIPTKEGASEPLFTGLQVNLSTGEISSESLTWPKDEWSIVPDTIEGA